MTWYSEREQDRDYRAGVRELGCTCPDTTPAHVHRVTCPLYEREEAHAEERHWERSE